MILGTSFLMSFPGTDDGSHVLFNFHDFVAAEFSTDPVTGKPLCKILLRCGKDFWMTSSQKEFIDAIANAYRSIDSEVIDNRKEKINDPNIQ
jgi:hypothetical protein